MNMVSPRIIPTPPRLWRQLSNLTVLILKIMHAWNKMSCQVDCIVQFKLQKIQKAVIPGESSVGDNELFANLKEEEKNSREAFKCVKIPF